MGRAIVLDMDGTLYKSQQYSRALEKAMGETVSEILRIPMGEAKRLLAENRAKYGTLTVSIEQLGIPRRKFYRLLASRLEPSKYVRRNKRLPSIIRKIRRLDLKVGLHTNSGRPLALKVLEALGCEEDDFDVLVTSDEAEPKPSPKAYLKACKLLGAKPTDAIYVGDRAVWELKPAKQLGMRTILVARRPIRSPWVDYSIKSLAELPSLLASGRLQRCD